MAQIRKLTARQQKFVDFYCSDPHNGRSAAEAAGYMPGNAASVAASRLLRMPQIRSAIERRVNTFARDSALIATRAERHEFWTAMARNPHLKPFERLKASELLGKASGDFIERHELTGKDGGPIQLGTTVVHELIAVVATVSKDETGEPEDE